ncbi:hypothetical protein EYF80_008933 [Liparis tanakae]|uniref:Uncharacterized protein n=1 Tax=Liparis tanakae TaxID=230148 RepID=A0A4Z2ITK9_9TELE|nr:hypothetical protein EYF80_008933 [Liparis tanakae]
MERASSIPGDPKGASPLFPTSTPTITWKNSLGELRAQQRRRKRRETLHKSQEVKRGKVGLLSLAYYLCMDTVPKKVKRLNDLESGQRCGPRAALVIIDDRKPAQASSDMWVLQAPVLSHNSTVHSTAGLSHRIRPCQKRLQAFFGQAGVVGETCDAGSFLKTLFCAF